MSSDVNRTPSERVDSCVIGAGPAGALADYSLAQDGHDVMILDAGPRFSREDLLQRMERYFRSAHVWTDVWEMSGDRDAYSSSGRLDYPLNTTRVKGIGKTTLHWLALVPWYHEKDFEMNSRYGLAKDWPISYEELRPYYATVEQEIGVAGGDDNPFVPPREEPFPMGEFDPSYADSLSRAACEELGIEMHTVPHARNSEPYDDRSVCSRYGTCDPVCPSSLAMMLADLLSECYAAEFDEVWKRERTATPVRVFAVHLHATGCSLRETQAILRLLGVKRSHQAIWH